MAEKWYMYRHPKTGAETKVIVKKGKAMEALFKRAKLKATGYQCLAIIDPVTVSHCKAGGA
jgi:hypothetical protein